MNKVLFFSVFLTGVLMTVFPQTQWTVNSTASWDAMVNGINNGGNNQTHIVTVVGRVSVPGRTQFIFHDVTGITVILQGNGTLALSSNGALLPFGSGKTIIVRDIALQGRDSNDAAAVVYVGSGGEFRMEGNASIRGNGIGGVFVGGTFIMENGNISGNTVPAANIHDENPMSFNGAGVNIRGGTFTMRGGTISGNFIEASSGGGGGVAVSDNGTFIMEGGTISSNFVNYGYDGMQAHGGGVYAGSGGTFTMRGGRISGNTAGIDGRWGQGGGVYVSSRGTFTMQGGTISGNIAYGSSNLPGLGGGVYIFSGFSNDDGGVFIKTGGTIYGDNETNAALRNASSGNANGHAVYYGYEFGANAKFLYRNTTLPANTSGNISTASQLPTTSGQTLNNWTMR